MLQTQNHKENVETVSAPRDLTTGKASNRVLAVNQVEGVDVVKTGRQVPGETDDVRVPERSRRIPDAFQQVSALDPLGNDTEGPVGLDHHAVKGTHGRMRANLFTHQKSQPFCGGSKANQIIIELPVQAYRLLPAAPPGPRDSCPSGT
jgi:hypothetical protein